MSKGQRTSVSNAKLKHLLKLADAYIIKVENGEWEVPRGAYKQTKSAADHIKTEMFKQSRQTRKTMDIKYVAEQERRRIISEENLREEGF